MPTQSNGSVTKKNTNRIKSTIVFEAKHMERMKVTKQRKGLNFSEQIRQLLELRESTIIDGKKDIVK